MVKAPAESPDFEASGSEFGDSDSGDAAVFFQRPMGKSRICLRDAMPDVALLFNNFLVDLCVQGL